MVHKQCVKQQDVEWFTRIIPSVLLEDQVVMLNFLIRNLENSMYTKVSDPGNLQNTKILSSIQLC